MWESWESFLLRGSSRLKLLSDQVNWFSHNMGFGKDILTKNPKCWKQSEGVIKWENISFIMLFCSESLPQAIKIISVVKKTTWRLSSLYQAISSKLFFCFVVKTTATNLWCCKLLYLWPKSHEGGWWPIQALPKEKEETSLSITDIITHRGWMSNETLWEINENSEKISMKVKEALPTQVRGGESIRSQDPNNSSDSETGCLVQLGPDKKVFDMQDQRGPRSKCLTRQVA